MDYKFIWRIKIGMRLNNCGVLSPKWTSTSCPVPRFEEYHGRGRRKCIRTIDWKPLLKVCLLKMRWPLYSWTHSRCGYLHNTALGQSSQHSNIDEEKAPLVAKEPPMVDGYLWRKGYFYLRFGHWFVTHDPWDGATTIHKWDISGKQEFDSVV